MQQDFAPPVQAVSDCRRGSIRVGYARRVLMVAGFFLLLWMILFGAKIDVRAYAPSAVREEWLAAEVLAPAEPEQEQRLRLQPGDTAEAALRRMGFTAGEAAGVIAAARPAHSLKHVIAGRDIRCVQRADGTHIYYNVDAEHRLHVFRFDDVMDWQAEIEPRLASSRIVAVHGEIRDSLFADAAGAGLDDRTTMNLVDIFAWDIDFAHDMRVGDRFSALMEESYDADGNALARTILAARFVNQGDVHSAIRFEIEPGRYEYYAEDGKNLRKAYLRSPVKYSRISSRYSSGRKHPVLGFTRAHKGVDYAAPIGTPVRAVGDGRIVFAGTKGGYGRFIEVRHTNPSHSTAYAHLSRYARGIRAGKRVQQGDVIGYVGASGLATGPHLHFEFRKNGYGVNPLTIKRPPGAAVPPDRMPRFESHAEGLLASLERVNMLAWN